MKLRSLLPRVALTRSVLGLALFPAWVVPAQAQSLIDLYQAARSHDATYQAAQAQYQAGQYGAAQAKAAILPTIAVTASMSQNSQQTTTDGTEGTKYNYNQTQTAISLTQPLFDLGRFSTFREGGQQYEQVEAQWISAQQALVLNVSQAYFDVLTAQDSLTFARAQKTALGEQLAAAKRKFEVGAATITDTRAAQAQYDSVVAQEISADNNLHIKKLVLDQLVGLTDAQPLPLIPGIALPAAEPLDVNYWVDQSLKLNPSVRAAQAALRIAEHESTKAVAGHLPTVNLNASQSLTKYDKNPSAAGLETSTPVTTVGVQLTLPLFAGFATQNKLRQTLAQEDQAKAQLEATQRSVVQNVRADYLNLLAGLSQVKALEAAEASFQSSLEANQLGYRVGANTNLDVLNAQSQLYQTKSSLSTARYNALLVNLKLRMDSGTLTGDDLQAINRLMALTQPR